MDVQCKNLTHICTKLYSAFKRTELGSMKFNYSLFQYKYLAADEMGGKKECFITDNLFSTNNRNEKLTLKFTELQRVLCVNAKSYFIRSLCCAQFTHHYHSCQSLP